MEDPDALNIFDRGYVDYPKFDLYRAKSVRFVTRLKSNADIHVMEEKWVDPTSIVTRDAIVKLGNKYTVLDGIPSSVNRMSRQRGKSIRILTSEFDLSAEEIGDLYRNRWQIELFFKWIKQHLRVKKCYGRRWRTDDAGCDVVW